MRQFSNQKFLAFDSTSSSKIVVSRLFLLGTAKIFHIVIMHYIISYHILEQRLVGPLTKFAFWLKPFVIPLNNNS